MKNYLKLMRVHHYIKNFLVFAALACSGQLTNPEKLMTGIIAFIAFCIASSAVYVINDICDAEKDRKHPIKCSRPIASGAVSVKNAIILTIILFAAAAACSCTLSHIAVLLLVLYVILNLGYSFGLKNIPIIDVSMLSAGFLIRVLYGACATNIVVSGWLYLTVITLSLYFALGKRRNELRQISNSETRRVLEVYPISFLDKNMTVCLTMANVFYALWALDKKTAVAYNTENLIFTVPVVLLITMKYSLDIESDVSGDPVEVLLHDKVLFALCVLYSALMFVILYVL